MLSAHLPLLSFVWLRWLACWGLLLIVSGCGGEGRSLGKLIPVKGRVAFDGRPLSEGRVTFIPTGEQAKGPTPEGEIQADGVYTLKTQGKEGVPAGTYRVILAPGPEDKLVAAMMDPRYGHPDQSPLLIEVAENKPEAAYNLNIKSRGRR